MAVKGGVLRDTPNPVPESNPRMTTQQDRWFILFGPGRIVVTGELSVGRDESCTIVLDSDEVSRVHFRIAPSPDGGLVLRDESSANGTWLNNERIQRDVPLQSGDVIRVGPHSLKIEHVRAQREPGSVANMNVGPVLAEAAMGESVPPLRSKHPTARPPPAAISRSIESCTVKVAAFEGSSTGASFRDAVATGRWKAIMVVGDFDRPNDNLANAFRRHLRDVAPRNTSPGRLLREYQSLVLAVGTTMAVACAQTDASTGRLVIASAGRAVLWMVRRDGRAVRLPSGTSVELGVARATSYQDHHVDLAPHDLVLAPSRAISSWLELYLTSNSRQGAPGAEYVERLKREREKADAQGIVVCAWLEPASR